MRNKSASRRAQSRSSRPKHNPAVFLFCYHNLHGAEKPRGLERIIRRPVAQRRHLNQRMRRGGYSVMVRERHLPGVDDWDTR